MASVDESPLNLQVRLSDASTFPLVVARTATVKELKEAAATPAACPTALQKLVYKVRSALVTWRLRSDRRVALPAPFLSLLCPAMPHYKGTSGAVAVQRSGCMGTAAFTAVSTENAHAHYPPSPSQGRILKDDDTLLSYGMESGHVRIRVSTPNDRSPQFRRSTRTRTSFFVCDLSPLCRPCIWSSRGPPRLLRPPHPLHQLLCPQPPPLVVPPPRLTPSP